MISALQLKNNPPFTIPRRSLDPQYHTRSHILGPVGVYFPLAICPRRCCRGIIIVVVVGVLDIQLGKRLSQVVLWLVPGYGTGHGRLSRRVVVVVVVSS